MVWKENSLKHILEKWGVFFFRFCIAIFCRHLQRTSKKFVHKEVLELLNFGQNVKNIIDLVYCLLKINGMKGQLGRSSFMELERFFTIPFFRFFLTFFGIYRGIYITDHLRLLYLYAFPIASLDFYRIGPLGQFDLVVAMSVCFCVSVLSCVCLSPFHVLYCEAYYAPTSQSQSSKILENRKPLGKSAGKKWSQNWTF